MSAELLEQLTAARFPYVCFVCVSDVPHLVHTKNGEHCRWELQQNPTLDELIAACGEDFYRLTKGNNGLWYAEGDHMEGPPTSLGFTPDEAVAKLWLALHPQ